MSRDCRGAVRARLVALLVTLAAGAITCPAWAASPDLAQRRLVTREIAKLPVQLEERLPPARTPRLVWNDLVLAGVPAAIPLGRSFTGSWTDGTVLKGGLDPRSLRLSWLEPGKLVLVTWGTDPEGLTNQRREGVIVLLWDGDRFRELVRDAFFSYGAVGAGNWMAVDLDVRWDATTQTMTLTRTVRDEVTEETHSESTTRHVWTSWLSGDRLEQVGSARYVDLAERTPVDEVARQAGITVDDLIRLNPELDRGGRARGRIRIADAIAPYEHENDDGICEAPCP
jgi:hypothetical protein